MKFTKGVSGNPGGRPKGLERLVRETVGDDIVEIIKAQVAIAKGEKPKGMDNLPAIKPSDMTKAAEWIGDRGWGKAKQVVRIGEASAADLNFDEMSDEELDRELARLEADLGSSAHDGDGTSRED